MRAAIANAHFEQAQSLQRSGDTAGAETAYREAIDIDEKITTERPEVHFYRERLALSCRLVASLLLARNRTSEAEEFNRRALGLYEDLVAQYPTEIVYREGQAGSARRLGWVIQKAGRPAEAEFAYRQSVDLYEKLAADHPGPWYRHELAFAYWRLGRLLGKTERASEGEQPCRQALTLEEKNAAEFPDNASYRERVSIYLSELAENLLQQGRHDQAAKLAEETLEALRHEPGARRMAENAAFRGRGLLARFLYAAPQSWIGRREIAPAPVSDATREAYRQAVRSLAEVEREIVLQLSAHAAAVWQTVLDRLEGDPLFPPDVMEGLRAAEVRWNDESPDCDLATEPITDPIGPDGWPVDCIDPDELTPCPKCGTLELWQLVAGDLFGLTPGRWRCMKCDPPTAARRLAEAAERIRRRANRKTTTRQNG